MNSSIKKDSFNYLISFVLPGVINFFSIPIIKKLIGTANYGEFTLWYSSFFIIIAFSSSWQALYIIRFKADYKNPQPLYYQVYKIIGIIILIISSAALIGAIVISKNVLFSILFSTAMGLCIMQSALNSITQANFKSRVIAISETIRVITFFITYFLLLHFSGKYFMEKLFFALFFSYAVSIYILYRNNDLSFLKNRRDYKDNPLPYKEVVRFGFPLMMWFLVSTSIPFLDKLLIAKKFGFDIQGDYQAIFDLVFKSITIIFTPIATAMFPHLAAAYIERNFNLIKKTLNKIILLQVGIMCISILAYCLGVWKILFKLLNIEDSSTFYVTGVIILLVSFVWQIGITIHKPLELMKITKLQLYYILWSFVVTLLTLSIVYFANMSLVFYPLGILLGSFTYIVLCVKKIYAIYKSPMFNN